MTAFPRYLSQRLKTYEQFQDSLIDATRYYYRRHNGGGYQIEIG